MAKQTKALISVLAIAIILTGGYFIYNKLLALKLSVPPEKTVPEKQIVSSGKIFPKLTISILPKFETVAYKSSSFSVSVKNEKGHPEVKNLNFALRGIAGEVSPTNVSINPGESTEFKVKLDKLEPGDYNLSLKITGEPEIDITRTVSIESRMVVGLDAYHTGGDLYNSDIWSGNYYEAGFAKYLRENGIKTKIIKSQLTPELLNSINTFIVVIPEQPFSSSEKKALKKFLDKKGGLLLIGFGGGTYESFLTFLNDIADSLHLRIRFTRSQGYVKGGWTTEITKNPITSGIEKIWWEGGYPLEVRPPMTPLVKKEGGIIYAIQHYSHGKIAIMLDTSLLRVTCHPLYAPGCLQQNQLNLNLVKWLSTPEIFEEMG